MSEDKSPRNTDSQSRIAALEAELERVRQERDVAEHEREQYRKLYMLVLYELERLKRQLFGKKAESVDPAQVQLAFGPVFEALARAQTGDAGAQADLEAELQKLREDRRPNGRRRRQWQGKAPLQARAARLQRGASARRDACA
ncbi:MAG: hypothetical protein JW940_00930 [Polyangiaceae bacterium]|nr:hypothetical protein [Polyangiaceae bacterium]